MIRTGNNRPQSPPNPQPNNRQKKIDLRLRHRLRRHHLRHRLRRHHLRSRRMKKGNKFPD